MSAAVNSTSENHQRTYSLPEVSHDHKLRRAAVIKAHEVKQRRELIHENYSSVGSLYRNRGSSEREEHMRMAQLNPSSMSAVYSRQPHSTSSLTRVRTPCEIIREYSSMEDVFYEKSYTNRNRLPAFSQNGMPPKVHPIRQSTSSLTRNTPNELPLAPPEKRPSVDLITSTTGEKRMRKLFICLVIALVVTMLVAVWLAVGMLFSQTAKLEYEVVQLRRQLFSLNSSLVRSGRSLNKLPTEPFASIAMLLFNISQMKIQLESRNNSLHTDISGVIKNSCNYSNFSLLNSHNATVKNHLDTQAVNNIFKSFMLKNYLSEKKLNTFATFLEIASHLKIPLGNTCADILINFPCASSGYYYINNTEKSVFKVFCDMSLSCNGMAGGWMRIAQLNASSLDYQCPSGFNISENSGIFSCAMNSEIPGCSSIVFSSKKLRSSKVCGTVRAYSKKSQNEPQTSFSASHSRSLSGSRASLPISHAQTPVKGSLSKSLSGFHSSVHSLNENYLDGISITSGMPRRHIWSYVAGQCPCTEGKPSYVRNHYSCGFRADDCPISGICTLPIWGRTGKCLSYNLPWFYRETEFSVLDDVEVRVCGNPHVGNEQILIGVVQVFVQ